MHKLQKIEAGLRFVIKTPIILSVMILMAFLNVFTFNFNVLVPLFAKNVFHGDAQLFGFLMTAIGTGALLGTLILAANSRKPPKTRTVALAAIAICIFELLITPVKSYSLAYLMLFMVGISVITYSTTSNALIQTQTPHHLLGRVMSIYTLVFAGFSPFGSFFSGFIAHQWGASFALGLGAAIGLGAVIVLLIRFPKVFLLKYDLFSAPGIEFIERMNPTWSRNNKNEVSEINVPRQGGYKNGPLPSILYDVHKAPIT